jgi:hypothetical protein
MDHPVEKEKQHLCVQCNKTFSTKYTLATHMKTATHERKGESLTKQRLEAMRQRAIERKKQSDAKLYCEKCRKHFKSKSSMAVHVLSRAHIEGPIYDGTYEEWKNNPHRRRITRRLKREKDREAQVEETQVEETQVRS